MGGWVDFRWMTERYMGGLIDGLMIDGSMGLWMDGGLGRFQMDRWLMDTWMG